MNQVMVNIPIVLTLEPKELDVIVGALELAHMPHNLTDPVLRKIGQTAAAQVAQHQKEAERDQEDAKHPDVGDSDPGDSHSPSRSRGIKRTERSV